MSAHQYPFIDVAVHERVRLPFARGEAVVLFSLDMQSVLWANGRGAALFGHMSIYDFLDAPLPTGDVVFRQLAAAARQLPHSGIGRSMLLRIGTGYRGLPVNTHVERITLQPGQDAILFSTPSARTGETIAQRAASLLVGFDDPDTHMAVLGDDGAIVAASPGFGRLGISEEARRRMVEAARRETDGLIKRPVPTGKGLLPAALGRISDEPALNLLFAVETILGHMDPEQETGGAAPADAASTREGASLSSDIVADGLAELPAAGEPMQAQEPAEAIETVPVEGREPPPAVEPVADVSTELPADDIPVDATGDAPESDIAPAPATTDADIPAQAAQPGGEDDARPALQSHTEPAAAKPERSIRPVRFVWKIDAEGVFSELSDEFAAVVGEHAADVIGVQFTEVARRFGFDTDGAIAEQLHRRDTWSGKTIQWPIEGTNLLVPVDLAALPTYSRSREFDGFRGFGIVRIADAVEDPNGLGLKIGAHDVPDVDDFGQADISTDDAPGDMPDDLADAAHGEISPPPSVLDELLEEEMEGEAPASSEETVALIADSPDHTEADDQFRGERPALRLVEPAARRQSDKVVQLDDRRGRSALTSGEQAAFREIARQLGETFGKRQPGDVPQQDQPAAPQAEAGQHPTIGSKAESAAANPPAAEAAARAQEPTQADGQSADGDEIPGLEVGEHADDAPPKSLSITAARTAMDYGLTASVVDALPLALLIHAGDRMIHANPEFLALTGFASLDELEQAGGLDILLDQPEEEDAAQPGSMLLHHADGVTATPVTARLQSIRWESGTALMLALSPAAPFEAEAPAVEATVAESANLSALRNEANELRSILETATDGVVVVDQEGEIRSINRSASALFNYDEEEVRGKPFAILFAHESQKAVIDYLAGLAGHGVASVLNDGREVIGREASGGFIPLFMTMGRLSSSSGYCAVIRDITQWKRTEEELRNAKRAAETANAHKSEFLARVSHEIRTPLNAIIGFSDMMAGERFGPIGHPRYVEYANDIGRSGRHVLDIVNDLLDISKIEAGEMELDFTAVGLNDTISEAVALVQPQANSQRVIIRTSLSTAVPPVVADLRSIKQIALNILANAIRFTPSGGQIVVSTSYEVNGSVVLRIRDTGVGMTRSELEQAMKPFRQVTTGARKRGDGTGLGLPLTKAMVDANRAQFAINSSPNEGTLVEVTFPSPRVLAV
ncbi:PAS/PAC sensor signal transduction histidine kinase [Rhizobium subbaraonis]|uniref:histidine kinase n=1 Tax=Rhizobium subbaraonis TaxID=908946 RepID=A0A285UVN8_9HYPH|nr:PAS domain S-box protein [Rhizobium subbaraonis]SOC45438.1 PAS/PAC sensor signal transduction histidine kinase [Rhizobium subbaraonis]